MAVHGVGRESGIARPSLHAVDQRDFIKANAIIQFRKRSSEKSRQMPRAANHAPNRFRATALLARAGSVSYTAGARQLAAGCRAVMVSGVGLLQLPAFFPPANPTSP